MDSHLQYHHKVNLATLILLSSLQSTIMPPPPPLILEAFAMELEFTAADVLTDATCPDPPRPDQGRSWLLEGFLRRMCEADCIWCFQ